MLELLHSSEQIHQNHSLNQLASRGKHSVAVENVLYSVLFKMVSSGFCPPTSLAFKQEVFCASEDRLSNEKASGLVSRWDFLAYSTGKVATFWLLIRHLQKPKNTKAFFRKDRNQSNNQLAFVKISESLSRYAFWIRDEKIEILEGESLKRYLSNR